VTVQVLAGSVITHCRAWVGVAGGNLDVAQVDSSVEHGRDECVAKHVRMSLGCLYAGSFGEPPQAACGRVPVHPGAAGVEQDRSAGARAYCLVDGPADGWRQWDEDDFGAFAAHAQHPVAVLFAEVGDVGAGGFEDPQAEQPEHGHEGEVARVR
jgi:hypothetical protein